MSKIVRKSNYDHEDHRGNQYFIAQRISQRQAEAVVEVLNKLEHPGSDDFYVVVDNDYLLPPDWEP